MFVKPKLAQFITWWL